MNNPPNEIHWAPGDVVIHDADAKRPDLLMRVVGYTRDGRVRTVYLDPERQSRWGSERHSRLINRMVVLLDPRQFGIDPGDGLVRVEGGSRIISRPPISIGCISPEARLLLERAWEGWEQHRKGLPESMSDFEGGTYNPRESVYGCLYWLIRWSGLVRPADDGIRFEMRMPRRKAARRQPARSSQ